MDILVTKLALFRRCNGVLVIEQVAPGITMEGVLAADWHRCGGGGGK